MDVKGANRMGGDLVIGLDGGGTGCRARLYGPDGRALGEGEGGPANLLIGDGALPFASILAAAGAAVAAAGLAPPALARCRAGLGVAGATTFGRARFFVRTPPFAETRIISDSHAAALGAHGGRDGGVVILGTGAVACVARDGRARDIGGWGYALDDLGSGADIGRQALRAALREHDRPEGPGAFAAAVLGALGRDAWGAVEWALTARPAELGALAPLVLDRSEAGDLTARALADAASAELVRLIRLCHAHGAERVALLGSVARRLAPSLPPEAAAGLVPPEGDAVDGAALAVRLRLGATA
jgi:glucosamine kinase